MVINKLWKCGLLVFLAITTGVIDAALAEMTNADVIKMVQAKVSTDVIISSIENTPTHFALDSDSIIALAQAGVPPEIIKAMNTKAASSTAPATNRPDRPNIGAQDKITVFVKDASGDGEFVDPDRRHAKAIQDSARDFQKALKEASHLRIVGSEKDALIVLEIIDRETKSSGSILWGVQNKSSLTLRLVVGSYTTEIKAESGMRGLTTGYSAAAAKAVKLVEDWASVNHDRLIALRSQEK